MPYNVKIWIFGSSGVCLGFLLVLLTGFGIPVFFDNFFVLSSNADLLTYRL